jgi:hypothetical protein
MTMQTEVDTEVEAGDVPDTVWRIPVTKAKQTLEVHSKDLPDHVYQYALELGLKTLLNRGQTTITKASIPDEDQRQAASLAKAEETLEAMYAGKIRIVGGSKADKVPREVTTEAMRVARNVVKDELKKNNIKISHVEASEITKAAKALLAADPSYIENAKDEIERRARTKVAIDVKALVPVSQKRVAAEKAKKAEKVLSQAKAGQVATRGRPQPSARQ